MYLPLGRYSYITLDNLSMYMYVSILKYDILITDKTRFKIKLILIMLIHV